FLPLLLTKRNRKNIDVVARGRWYPNIRETIAIGSTFSLTVLSWIFFRAESIPSAITYISGIFSLSTFSMPDFFNNRGALTTFIAIIVFTIVEWFGRENEYAIEQFGQNWRRPLRYGFYYVVIIAIVFLGGEEQEFIYFQF